MRRKSDETENSTRAAIRKKAEEIVSVRAEHVAGDDARVLVHELEVHQVELEIQNEELQIARAQGEQLLARYADLYDFSPVGYVSFGKDGTVLHANLTLTKFLGIPRARLINCRFGFFVSDSDRLIFNSFLDKMFAGEARGTCEIWLHPEGGEPMRARLEGEYIQDKQECRAAVIDVTENKRMGEASAAKDRFIATLSHELRTPLTPVLLAAQMLERMPGLSPSIRHYVQIIKRNTEIESTLVNDLLDMSRLMHGKVQISSTQIDLHDVIREALKVCESRVKEKGLEVNLALKSKNTKTVGDASRLQQVFWNLISNAIKFAPQGGKIIIESRDRFKDMEVRVTDSGIGIEPEALQRVFEPFEQCGQEHSGGLGLGLGISKGLVEMHQGTIEVKSQGRGKGSTFVVRIPVDVESRAKTLAEHAEVAPAVSRKILLVEDNQDTASLIKQALEMNGHQVTVADSVASGLRPAYEEHFDLLLCDIGLPDGTGIDLMNKLRAHKPSKTVAITGYGQPEDIERCKQAGFDRHVTKPVDLDELDKMIANL